MQCCYKCQERTTICHGKNEDGTYRCKRWKEEQEEKNKKRMLDQKNKEVPYYIGYRNKRLMIKKQD